MGLKQGTILQCGNGSTSHHCTRDNTSQTSLNQERAVFDYSSEMFVVVVPVVAIAIH